MKINRLNNLETTWAGKTCLCFEVLDSTNDYAKELAEEFVRKMNEPTAENALEDMKMSQMLFLTKDGEFYSTIAKEYLKILPLRQSTYS